MGTIDGCFGAIKICFGGINRCIIVVDRCVSDVMASCATTLMGVTTIAAT